MAEEMRQTEWLDELFPHAKKQRQELRDNALLVAQKFMVFSGPTADPRARELLDLWTAAIRRVSVPKGASAQEYAAVNALREFIEGIHAQIELAKQMQGSVPDWLNK